MSFNYLGTEYCDNVKRYIKSISFDVSRYGAYTETIKFLDEPKTELEAVLEVEKFLSQKVTLQFFKRVKDDLQCDDWELYENSIVGKLLGNAIFYEGLNDLSNGNYYLVTGS